MYRLEVLENLSVGVAVVDPSLEVSYANAEAQKILGLQREQLEGRLVANADLYLVDKQGNQLPLEEYPAARVLANGEPLRQLEIGVHNTRLGTSTWVLCDASAQCDKDGQVEFAVVSFVDITERKEFIPFREIVEFASDVVLVTKSGPLREGGPEVVYVNQAFTEMTGYKESEILGRTPRILQGPNTDPETRARIYEKLSHEAPVQEEILNYTKYGDPYWVELNIVPLHGDNGQITHFAAIERDINAQKQQTTDLISMAMRDALTGLLNRRGFLLEGQHMLQESQRSSSCCVAAVIDVDHFKSFNDNYGHDVGDQALVHLAEQLRQNLRSADIVGRLGGEEFAVVLSGAEPSPLVTKLESLCRAIAGASFETEDEVELALTVSIGVVESLPGEADLQGILKRADEALYRAKDAGRNRVETG